MARLLVGAVALTLAGSASGSPGPHRAACPKDSRFAGSKCIVLLRGVAHATPGPLYGPGGSSRIASIDTARLRGGFLEHPQPNSLLVEVTAKPAANVDVFADEGCYKGASYRVLPGQWPRRRPPWSLVVPYPAGVKKPDRCRLSVTAYYADHSRQGGTITVTLFERL
jgi:hypothetical protein